MRTVPSMEENDRIIREAIEGIRKSDELFLYFREATKESLDQC